MDSLHVLANLSAMSTLQRTAYSALPDAPVQPVVTRRRPWRTVHRAMRTLAARRRPAAVTCAPVASLPLRPCA
jgi:hypothetical protein